MTESSGQEVRLRRMFTWVTSSQTYFTQALRSDVQILAVPLHGG